MKQEPDRIRSRPIIVRRAALSVMGALSLMISTELQAVEQTDRSALVQPVAARATLPNDGAVTFIKGASDQLVTIVNGGESATEKRRRLRDVLQTSVDVDGLARFCLGRYWRMATPEQQAQYTELFRELLVAKISGHLGEYQGVRITMGRARTKADTEIVLTTVERPGNAAYQVDWVVSTDTGSPRIVDLLAEGTSLRMTQNRDFAAYLSRNQNDIPKLIEAMRTLTALSR